MSYTVSILSANDASHESAAVVLADDAGNKANLYLDFSTLLRSVRDPSVPAQDFLLLATAVYSLDKLVPRKIAGDLWTRSFDVTVPVEDPAAWKKAAGIA